MPFTGIPVVKEVSDGLVRITGLALPLGQAGTIALHSATLAPGIRLPVQFKPQDYAYPLAEDVTIQDSVQVLVNQVLPGTEAVSIGVLKSGTNPANFAIQLVNTSQGPQSILASAATFAVLAGTSIANTGASAITGNIGTAPGATITGFPPGTVSGSTNANNGAAQAAQTGAAAAYASLRAMTRGLNFTGIPLGGGQTLTPGVYTFDGNAAVSGTLTLDRAGDPNGLFVFQIAGNLSIAAAASVVAASLTEAQTVFWQVAGTVTIGAGATTIGAFVTEGNITLGAAAAVAAGQLITLGGGVVLNDNAIALPVLGEDLAPAGSGPLEIYIRFH